MGHRQGKLREHRPRTKTGGDAEDGTRGCTQPTNAADSFFALLQDTPCVRPTHITHRAHELDDTIMYRTALGFTARLDRQAAFRKCVSNPLLRARHAHALAPEAPNAATASHRRRSQRRFSAASSGGGDSRAASSGT